MVAGLCVYSRTDIFYSIRVAPSRFLETILVTSSFPTMAQIDGNEPKKEPKQRDIEYSLKYNDAEFEYRHVILPSEIIKKLPKPMRLLSETEWRSLGVQQSLGWVHYEVHQPEPHVLLFRRPLGTNPTTGRVDK